MKKRILGICVLIFAGFAATSLFGTVQSVDPSELVPSSDHKKATLIITKVIDRYHYKKASLDDTISEKILERYLETLDPNRSIFLLSDVASFNRYKTKFDDYLRTARLDPAFSIFRIYRQRLEDRVDYALSILDRGFNFSIDEEYKFDRSEAEWMPNKSRLDELWRKRVKNDFLNLLMAGKDHDEARDTLRKRYQGMKRRVSQLKPDDVYQNFINAYTLSLEPHTSYMSPSTSENFDISMRLSLEGIGAVLRAENEYTVVQKTVSGGPAKLSGQIKAGDRIVGVAQGLEGAMEDVIGWRLQDVVEKIRGPKGSVVRLQLMPKDVGSHGPSKTVTLVRNRIKLEEQAAKASVIKGLNGMGDIRIGVIEVPTFYRDFRAESRGERDFRSTTRDVRNLVTDLKARGVDGIVIDLRQNGGGSLSEATELTGLFIESGPVVQVRDAFGEIEVEKDPDPEIIYSGPLAVLVDRNSASASEIFAGAIQDYQRGIVIGEPTFGKGTVQTLVDLGRFVPGADVNLGRLRLTMAQFFRIKGGSTQHRGVVPDIVYPTAGYAADHGERALDNALPWARIKPVQFSPQGLTSVARLREYHKHRIQSDPGFEWLSAEENLLQEVEKNRTVSLLETSRRAEFEKREKVRKEHKNRFRQSRGLQVRTDDQENDERDNEAEDKAIAQIWLDEAVRILSDQISTELRPRAAMVR